MEPMSRLEPPFGLRITNGAISRKIPIDSDLFAGTKLREGSDGRGDQTTTLKKGVSHEKYSVFCHCSGAIPFGLSD
jgi:hypothetical protein